MSTSNLGLGVAFPKMLPITGTWAVPIALYSVFLSGRIVYYRINTKTLLGDKGAETAHPLFRATRAHNNYLDTAPLALALAAVLELNGASKQVLNYALGLYLALRVAHLEAGLMANSDGMGVGRPVGYFGTQGLLIGGAIYLADLVKGYWGF